MSCSRWNSRDTTCSRRWHTVRRRDIIINMSWWILHILGLSWICGIPSSPILQNWDAGRFDTRMEIHQYIDCWECSVYRYRGISVRPSPFITRWYARWRRDRGQSLYLCHKIQRYVKLFHVTRSQEMSYMLKILNFEIFWQILNFNILKQKN